MKKRIAALMVLVLLMGCTVPAAAYTVDEKFWGQAENQAVTGTLSFSVTGDAAAMDEAVFQMLKQVLPQTEIDFFVTLYRKQPRGAIVKIAGADGSEKTVEALFDDDTLAIGSDAIGEEGAYYLLEKQALRTDEDGIPGIFDVLQLLDAADETWKEKAQEQLGYYQALLSVWMNDYAGAAMGREGDVLYSELSCTIPAAAVKEQVKAMLHTFYADEQTRALLWEVLEGTGAEIYLNPAMESVFCAMVEGTKLTGDLQVVRRFDNHGALLKDSISLPLGEVTASLYTGIMWQRISLEMTGRGDIACTLEGTAGETMHFSMNKMEDGSVSGQIVKDLPQEHTGYAYEWKWQAMEETYTLQTDLCERLMQGTLNLIPDEKTDAPEQQITLDVRFTSQSRSRSPARMEAELVWSEGQGEATVAVSVNAQTSAPGDVKDVNGLDNTVLFHSLPEEEKQAWLTELLLLPFNQAVTLPE